MLRAEYEEHVQHLIGVSLSVFQASSALDADNWRKAEALITEALHKNPRLQGANSILEFRTFFVLASYQRLPAAKESYGADEVPCGRPA